VCKLLLFCVLNQDRIAAVYIASSIVCYNTMYLHEPVAMVTNVGTPIGALEEILGRIYACFHSCTLVYMLRPAGSIN